MAVSTATGEVTMSDISLRPARPGDDALLASLHAVSWQHAYAGQLPADFLRDELGDFMAAKWAARLAEPAGTYRIAIAEVAGVAAGFVCLWPAAEPHKGVYLDNLHVLPGLSGPGPGPAADGVGSRRNTAGLAAAAAVFVCAGGQRAGAGGVPAHGRI